MSRRLVITTSSFTLLITIAASLILTFSLNLGNLAPVDAINFLQGATVNQANGTGGIRMAGEGLSQSQLAGVPAQGTAWQVGQIVGLPKGTLIYQGNGFDYPINACVPEDNWLVLVTGGPRTADGYVWYDTSRQAVDHLPTSGTGWVAPDATTVQCPTDGTPPVPGDTILPVISKVDFRQDGNGRAVVIATITDNVAVAGAWLWWNGHEYPMQLTGSDRYEAVIGRDLNGALRDYSILAVDTSGNVGEWHSTKAARIAYSSMAGIAKNTGSALEPVNTAVGSFYSQHQDIYVPAPGLPFDFIRTYNSVAAQFDGPFGFGWTHKYNLHLQVVDDLLLHGVVVTFEDGRTANFEVNGSGFVSPPGDQNTLAREGSGYVLTTPRQVKYFFNENGKLTSIQDSNGNTMQFSYSGDHLAQITDTAGRVYSVEYNGDHISKIGDVLGRSYEFTYDADGNLKTYSNPEDGLIQYTYNAEHWLLTITDPNDHVFVNNTYDDRGRIIEQRDASNSLSTISYPNERTAIITDNLEKVTKHFYDDNLRLIEDKDANGYSIFYQYDSDDNVILIKDLGGHETKYTYDSSGNVLTRTDALDQTAYFRYDGQNNLIYQKDEAGAETTLEYDGYNNLFHVYDAEGGDTFITYNGLGLIETLQDANEHTTRYVYDDQGNLQTITDALNNVTIFEHDAVGRQIAMTDANNHSVHFEYDKNDRVKGITDPNGKTTQFTYDPVGNLKSVTDRRGYATLYSYNENDNLIQVTDPRGNVARYSYDLMYHRKTFQNWRGFVTHYQYDDVYNLTKVIDAQGASTVFGYDADRNLIIITDALDQETRMEYDPLHRTAIVTNALGGVTKYTYDQVGRPLSVLDPKEGNTQYIYDRLGRLLKLTDALSNATNFTYDPAGNLLSTTNARGFTTRYHYNAVNQLLDQISPLGRNMRMTYDGVGNIASITDARDNTTSFAYDANDNLIDVTDALLNHIRYTYDEEDHRLTVTDQNGHTIKSTYDETGNRANLILPMGETTSFGYDENGNLIAVTNAKTKTTQFTYDKVDLLKSEINPLGLVTSYDYDALHRLIKKTDANGNPTQYGYNALDWLTSVTDSLNGVTAYEYDPLGNLTAQIDANTHRTEFGVNILGQVVSETNALDKVWGYEYDPVGNLVKRTDANGVATNYTFDEDNLLTDISYPTGPGTNFAYDPNKNLSEMVDSSGTSAFIYDPLNRLTQAGHTAGLLAAKALKYDYDPASNLTQIIYPDGKQVNYAYNANDWLISTAAPVGVTSYTYDPVGLITHQQNPNGTWTDSMYDDANRLIKLLNGKPAASTNLISSFEYTLDKVGNRTRTVERGTRGQVVTWTKDYTYDKLYRLLQSVETPSAKPYQTLTSAFTYDAVGNRLSMKTNIADKPNTPALPPATTTKYTYNAGNQLITAASPAGTTQFGYDANGNRISMSGPARAINYVYDFENRMISAKTYDVLKSGKLQPDSTLDFTYDGLNRRVERGVIDKGVRKTAAFLYNGLGYDLLAQYVDPGSPRTTYYYRDPMQVLSRQEIQGSGAGLGYFYHYDSLGSVSAWTNHAGQETQEYAYAPYGRLIDNNGPDNASNKTDPHNSLTFSGKLWDNETETYYFGARDYDPASGTWLTQDPYRGRIVEPMTLHRYGYVGDNPINATDFWGFSTLTWSEFLKLQETKNNLLTQNEILQTQFRNNVTDLYKLPPLWQRLMSAQSLQNIFQILSQESSMKQNIAYLTLALKSSSEELRKVRQSIADYYQNGFNVGQCTRFVADKKVVDWRGDGYEWAANAQTSGYEVSGTARVGDIVVFGQWTQGTGVAGHVGIVTAVYQTPGKDTIFDLAEDNWGKRTKLPHEGPGMLFIHDVPSR
jgi:RHS repeat-associated protein